MSFHIGILGFVSTSQSLARQGILQLLIVAPTLI
jgi:hypothetical protein